MDNMQVCNGVIRQNVSFLRVIQDWEEDVVLTFVGVLHSLRRRQGGEHCIWWIYSKRKKFDELSTSRGFFFTLCLQWLMVRF